MHLSEEKKRLRMSINERIDRMTKQERSAQGRTVSRLLLPCIEAGSTVTAFFPLTNEVNIQPLLAELLKRGDAVYLPCFEEGDMVFRKMIDIESLQPGAFTIPEPSHTAKLLDPPILDIAIIPARAFDKTGNRLGRGNGGFDRWIRKQREVNPETKFIGVCLECQIVAEVPVEEHDEKVDAVATPRGIVECASHEDSGEQGNRGTGKSAAFL